MGWGAEFGVQTENHTCIKEKGVQHLQLGVSIQRHKTQGITTSQIGRCTVVGTQQLFRVV